MRRTTSSWLSTIAKLGFRRSRSRISGSRGPRYVDGNSRLHRLEVLEGRCLLATYSVDSLSDEVDLGDGVTTLREAVYAANTDSTVDLIQFNPSLTNNGPATIELTDELQVSQSVSIDGPGANLLTIKAYDPNLSLPFDEDTAHDGDGDRIFYVYKSSGNAIDVEIEGLTLTGGDVNSYGGAIRNRGENLTLDGVYIVGNTVVGNGIDGNGNAMGVGGGIHQIGGSLTVINSTLAQNTAQLTSNSSYLTTNGRGGAIYAKDATVTIYNSTIAHNQAKFEGGGLYFTGTADATLTNVTIYRNRLTADPLVTNGVVSGGGVAVGGSADVELYNTLVAGNVRTIDISDNWVTEINPTPSRIARTADDVSGNFNAASSHNLIGYDEDSGNNLQNGEDVNQVGGPDLTNDGTYNPTGIDPRLAPLGDNGGSVPTLALLPGSQAIDAGDDDWVLQGVTTDQRGSARFMGPSGTGTVDIGAHEAGIIVTSLEDGDVSGEVTLRNAIDAWTSTSLRGEIIFHTAIVPTNPQYLLDAYTIALTEGELSIDSNLSIQGPGSKLLRIDAEENSRIFNVSSGATATISGLEMTRGSSPGTDDGGAILNAGDLTLETVVLSASTSDGDGGAIFSTGTLRIVESTLRDNWGDAGGAIGVSSDAADALVIERSALIDNHAVVSAGALLLSGTNGNGAARIVGSTFSDNDSAGHAGAIQLASSAAPALTIVNGTITLNEANGSSGEGGGIQIVGGNVTLQNTIVVGNSAAAAADDDIYGSLHISSDYNLLGSGEESVQPGNNIYDDDPGLAELDDNGGPTLSHALTKGSPAIDAGNDVVLTAKMTTDQRGFSRAVGSTGVGTIDIGAYEVGLVVTTWGDAPVYSANVGSTLSLREALYLAEHKLPEADYITFDSDVFGVERTITLGEDENGDPIYEDAEDLAHLSDLPVESDVQIVGPGADLLTIDAAAQEKIDAFVDDPNTEEDEEDNFAGVRVFYIGDHDSRNALVPKLHTLDEDPTNPFFEWVTASISGMTMTGGRLESDTPGGGVYNGGDLTLDSVVIRDNYSGKWGGGIYTLGDLWLENSVVDSNRASGVPGAYGGGISAQGISEPIDDTTDDGQQLNLIRPGSVIIVDSQIIRNGSVHVGAIDCEDGVFNIQFHNSTFAENYGAPLSSDAEGEELTVGVGGVQLRNLDHNDLMLGGLAPTIDGRAKAIISNTTISNNFTSGGIGGVKIKGVVDATFVSSTIAFNRSPSEGNGITLNGRNAQVMGQTIYDNSVTLYNTIVAHNMVDGTNEEHNLFGKFESSSSHNLISFDEDLNNGLNQSTQLGNIVGESDEILAGLTPLDGYGGILLPDGSYLLTHALALGSRAIDAGDSAAVAGAGGVPLFDQRGSGFDRITDGDGSSGARIDIGAFELREADEAIVLVTTKDDEDDADPHEDLDALSLREAVALVADQPVTSSNLIRFSSHLLEGVEVHWSNPDEENWHGDYETNSWVAIPEHLFDLSLGQIVLGVDTDITGWGAKLLTIDANAQSRVLSVSSGVDAAISDVTITGGTVTGSNRGGGIYNAGDLDLTRVDVTDNHSANHGGGIYNVQGTLTILGSTISLNSAATGGGISSHSEALESILIRDSAIIQNEADNAGGIRLDDIDNVNNGESAKFINSTFSGNSAIYQAGAIQTTPGFSLTIVNNTITANSAGGEGGGISNSGGGVTIHNTILAGNFAGTSGSEDHGGSSLNSASSYNLIGANVNVSGPGNGTGTKQLTGTQTAGLTSLGNYGGPTKSHALIPTSADIDAIDAGDNAIAIAYGLTHDQRGQSRIVDWNGVGGDRIDIGAVELAFEEEFA